MAEINPTIRIFISSPGDVAEERDRARQVVESLRRRYAGRFDLKPVLWEDLPLQGDMSFQEGIDLMLSREHGIDIAVFILWARLGSPPAVLTRRHDGSAYRSGTERELDLMLTARRQTDGARPALMVYTRRDDTSFVERLRGKPASEQMELSTQKERVEKFIIEEFHDRDGGHNIRAYHSFDRPVAFAQRLRTHLTELLDAMAGEGLTRAVWDVESQGPPFLGLEAFQKQHADVFFGRESETLEARHTLGEQARRGCAFLLLSGASGSGKSSLARAGVLPAVIENELDEQVAAWRTLITTPLELGLDPLGGLVSRLAASDVLPQLCDDTGLSDDLTDGLRRDPDLTIRLRIRGAFGRASKVQGGGLRVLIVLDQLEELFVSPALSDAVRNEFFLALEALARSGHIWVIATVRSDFFSHVQAQPALVRMLESGGLMSVLPPRTDSLRLLIEEPARLAGLSFEQRSGNSLAGRILRDAASHAELLPLLEYVLRELFERRTSQQVLTWDAYENLGGVEGALAERAEHVFLALPNDAKNAFGGVLKALVTLGHESSDGDGDQIVRQRVPLELLTRDAGATKLLQAFIRDRLLTTSNDPVTGRAIITVAHESLLRVWPRAVAWATLNRDFLRVRLRLRSALTAWNEEKNRSADLLLPPGKPLEDARALAEAYASDLTTEERAFIHASVQNHESREQKARRMRQIAIVVLSCMIVLVLSGGFIAWSQRRLAEKEQAKAEVEGRRALKAQLDADQSREQLKQEKLSLIQIQSDLVRQREDLDNAEKRKAEVEQLIIQQGGVKNVAELLRAQKQENADLVAWIDHLKLELSDARKNLPATRNPTAPNPVISPPTSTADPFATPLPPLQVVVTQIIEGGQGESIGLRTGDIILTYSGQKIISVEQLIRLTGESKGGATELTVRREENEMQFKAKAGRLDLMIENQPLKASAGTK